MFFLYCQVFPLQALLLDARALLQGAISAFPDLLHGLLLLFVLRHDLRWHDLGHRHCKNTLTYRLQHYYPVISAWTVSNLPFFCLTVPSVTTTDCCLDLITSERLIPLVLVNHSPLFSDLVKHLIYYVIFQRKSVSFGIAVQFL